MEYCNKFRRLHIRTLDGSQPRTLMVDDSQTVGQLMIFVCAQMGIANYEEYSLIHDLSETERNERTQTLRKSSQQQQQDKTLSRDHKRMEELKKKLHTEDDSEFQLSFFYPFYIYCFNQLC